MNPTDYAEKPPLPGSKPYEAVKEMRNAQLRDKRDREAEIVGLGHRRSVDSSLKFIWEWTRKKSLI